MTILNQILERVLSAADRDIPPPVEAGWRLGVGAPDSPEQLGVVPAMVQQLSQGTPLGALNAQFTDIQEASRTLGETGKRFVDVAAVLDAHRERVDLALDWRRSIADLMLLADVDNSLHARRQLARELGGPADTDDIAALDKWLHHAVMEELAEHGGEVPQDLLKP